ncbi:MAG: type IV toxin-antitoxin system AbiEi family antitoxin domain-containing protein [Actinomycetota bacterium]|nr:type IV toxin-antitoxin system AbiEi family antitoxin domain-containing protein [Actinomycetota bacterium]
MNPRVALNQIACRHYALVTADQAVAAGLNLSRIRRRVRSGEWVVVRPGVYSVGGVPPTWTQTVAAVALATQPRAWVSHRTAAQLWGLPGIEGEEIEIVTDLHRRVRLDGVRGHRSGALFTADLTRLRGIPVTSPARTLVDLSDSLSADRLGNVLDHALRVRLVTLDVLRTCIGRLGGGPGRKPAVVHSVLAERLPGYDPGDSDLETRVLRALVAAGLPVPVQQHRVRLDGRAYRLDLAYPALKLAIELDGWEFHGRRSAFDDDRARANLLVVHGWTLLRFTSRSTDAEIVAIVETARRTIVRSGAA